MALPWKSRAQLMESARREQERLNIKRRAEAAAKLQQKREAEAKEDAEDVRGP